MVRYFSSRMKVISVKIKKILKRYQYNTKHLGDLIDCVIGDSDERSIWVAEGMKIVLSELVSTNKELEKILSIFYGKNKD